MPEGLGCTQGCFISLRGTETPEGRPCPCSRGEAEHNPMDLARTRQEHPFGELLRALRALSLMPPPARAPALLPL